MMFTLILHVVAGWWRRVTQPRSPYYAMLRLRSLDDRVVPSSSPWVPASQSWSPEVFQFRSDETSLDGLIRLSPFHTQRADYDEPGPSSDSPGTLSVAGFMAIFLGSAAVVPYDREEDAACLCPFHGVQVA